MAEAVLVGVAVNVFNILRSSLIQKVASSWGAIEQFRRFRNNVEAIKPVLVDAEKRQHGSEAIRKWLADLQDVMYDADDLVEEIYAEAKRQEMINVTAKNNKIVKRVRAFFSWSSNPLLYRLRLADRVQEITKKLDDLKSNMGVFKFLVVDAEEQVILTKREETMPFVEADDIIGREDDKKAIINMLLEVNDECQEKAVVIPIVGIGGLGKTALAQLVYNDKIIEDTFKPKKWVCISDDFDVQGIVKKIVGREHDDKVKFEELVEIFRREFENRRYLIVLDDIWNEKPEEWRSLKRIFPAGDKGSKIIVTTRSETVANIMRSGIVPIYKLKGLSPDKSWSLFKAVTQQPDLEENIELARVGRKIVNKCANVPLAIRTLGSLLCHKDAAEWSHINDHELSNIEQNEKEILPVLKLSYNHLPSQLKNCFAYCAVFPKDYRLCKEWLVYAWLAAGFIQPSNENQSLEEAGEIAFNSLLKRCFFQNVERNYSGTIQAFTMHDLIHDLAQSVAGKQVASIESSKPEFPSEAAIRYVNFNGVKSTWEIPSHLLRAKRLRTCTLTWRSNVSLPKSSCDDFVTRFKLLRYVDFHRMGLRKLPSSIGELKLLRYLDLSCNMYLESLPSSIVKLVNLLILDPYECELLRELPRNFKKLVSLRWLDITGCVSLRSKLSEINQLQFLLQNPINLTKISIDTSNCWWKDIPEVLTLAGHIDNKQLSASLLQVRVDYDVLLESEKFPTSLEVLEIKEYHSNRLPSCGINESPASFTKLVEIKIFGHCPSLKYLPFFSGLFSLKILILRQMKVLEYIEHDSELKASSSSSSTSLSSFASTTFFPCLEELELSNLPCLKAWSVKLASQANDDVQNHQSMPSFPRLSILSITECPELTSMPLVPHIEALHLRCVNEKLSQTLMAQRGLRQQIN